jgi:hypothetical protein
MDLHHEGLKMTVQSKYVAQFSHYIYIFTSTVVVFDFYPLYCTDTSGWNTSILNAACGFRSLSVSVYPYVYLSADSYC